MKKPLTDAFISAATVPPGVSRIDVWDQKLSGFGLRISESNRKTWTVVYRRRSDRRQCRVTLGQYPLISLADARDLARGLLGKVALGGDPVGEREQARLSLSFEALAQLYLERHAQVNKSQRAAAEDKRIIERELLPVWRHRRAADLRRHDIISVLDGIVAREAPVMANRVRSLISKLFNFAVDRNLLEFHPAAGLRRPAVERPRDRVLSANELRQVWAVLDVVGLKVSKLIKLLFFTAARRGEVLGMNWDEIDLVGAWWVIPAERSKNHIAHRVPLVPGAIELLRSLGPKDEGLVFPGLKADRPLKALAQPLARLVKASGVSFSYHDIRRTTATYLASLGVDRFLLSKLLNHVERSVTGVYDRFSYDDPKRAALLKWEGRLNAIVTGQSASNVVAIAS
jgi:integrase